MRDRYINLEGTFNFRDIGGYVTEEGKKVVYGKLFRSDALSGLTDRDVKQLQAMGIKTIIDYRGEKERVGNENVEVPETTTYYLDPVADIAALASAEFKDQINLHDFSQLTGELAKDLMVNQNKAFVKDERAIAAFREMLKLVLNEGNTPLVQHCRGGKDRTGYGVALILLLLGVSREDVMADYMLTNHYKKEKNETSLAEILEKTKNDDLVAGLRHLKEANEEFLATALDLIESEYGDVVTYAKVVLGLATDDIQQLKTMYLE